MVTRKFAVCRRFTTWVTLATFVLGFIGFPVSQARAQVVDADLAARIRAAAAASGLTPLADVPIPTVPLDNFLNTVGGSVDPAALTAALRLGKAFFWDMQTGSDGQACGSCHFHAGADNRARNQLSPVGSQPGFDPEGGLITNLFLFGNTLLPDVPGIQKFGPDYTLKAENFPFHVLKDPEENNFNLRVIRRDTNDIASSQGVFAADFTAIAAPLLDAGIPRLGPIFNTQTPNSKSIAKNTRRVEPRHTPTFINALFNHSNFWDGRAHNLFNGVSVIGPLDNTAMIWVDNDGPGGAAPTQVSVFIDNSSLASQAVGPPTSNLEMSFFNRPFPMIGRKLLGLPPLGQQIVDNTDSVLGSLSNFPLNGINTSYPALIQAAFQEKYWNGDNVTLTVNVGGTPQTLSFTLMEANFTLFWGLANQIYEFTVISDNTPFDAFMAGDNTALTPIQLQGLLVFLNRGLRGNDPAVDNAIGEFEADNPGIVIGAGNCISCHGSALFTDAAFPALAENGGLELLEIEDTAVVSDNGFLAIDNTVQALLDSGFSNIGVRSTTDDLARGELQKDFPVSFSRQLIFNTFLLDGVIDPADFPCTPGVDCPNRQLVDGAFKVPGLRNVEITGPYFHNGGQATLEQVIEFYDRQGDFSAANIDNLDRNMVFVDIGELDEPPLVEFLLGLTDERVRQEMAPFDHPQILVPNGGTFASEQPRIEIPAVGAGGRPAATPPLPPLGTFLGLDPG